jgi:hypothetical protein
MGIRENNIEKYLEAEIAKKGGMTRKWVCPGRRGVPDRIVFYKKNIYFVELKTKQSKPSIFQVREIRALLNQGQKVFVLCSKEQVDWFMAYLKKRTENLGVFKHKK